MSCSDYAPLISKLIDDELDAAQRPIVQEHLRDCDRCRDLRESWSLHKAALQGFFRKHALGESFVERVRIENLKRVQPKRSDTERGWLHGDLFAWLQAAAAVLAILFLFSRFFPWDTQQGIAQVISPGGYLEVRASASLDWRPAVAGIMLHPGDWLRNREGNPAQILVHNSSMLMLQRGAVAQLGQGAKGAQDQFTLLQGSMESDTGGSGRRVAVATPAGNIAAESSRFGVRVESLPIPRLEVSGDTSEYLEVSVLPLSEVSVAEGNVQVQSGKIHRVIGAGGGALFTPSQFALIPAADAAHGAISAELQPVLGSIAGNGNLVSSLALSDGALKVSMTARQMPLRRVLEWTTESPIDGGDTIRVSGSLTYPANADAATIASALSSDLKIPITVEEADRSIKTASIAKKQESATAGNSSELTLRISAEGLLSFKFHNVPAIEAFRALRSGKQDLPSLAIGAESFPINLEAENLSPDEIVPYLQDKLGVSISETRRKVRVIRIGSIDAPARSSSQLPVRQGFEAKPSIAGGHDYTRQNIPLSEFENLHSEDGDNPAGRSGIQVVGNRYGAPSNELMSNRRISLQHGVFPSNPSLSLPDALWTVAAASVAGSSASVNANLESGNGGSGAIKLRASKHLAWPPATSGTDEPTYSFYNYSPNQVRAIWLGFDADGRLAAQFEMVVNERTKLEVKPAIDFGIRIEEGGHWEVFSDSPLYFSEDDSALAAGLFTALDGDRISIRWEFPAEILKPVDRKPVLWLINPSETISHVIVTVVVDDHAVASHMLYLAPHAGLNWSLDCLRSAYPDFAGLSPQAVLVVSAVEGTIAAGAISNPEWGQAAPRTGRGEWVH